MLSEDKHNSFLGPFISYEENKLLRIRCLFSTLLTIGLNKLECCSWQSFPAFSNIFIRLDPTPIRVKRTRCSTLGPAPGLTHKHKCRMEKPDRNTHSSLLGPFISY